jgi:glutamate-1-semialdehyde 2,1-aminomutase
VTGVERPRRSTPEEAPLAVPTSGGGELGRARAAIPGGVSSPVRSFAAVGGDPFFVARARGARLVDTNGNEYVDYVQSWGASILGHAHPKVVEAVQRAAADGTSYGAPTMREVALAEAIAAAVPSVEKVRLVSSGTEASMTAVRLARGVTARPKIVKFAGCYHGHADALLVAAGSGVATLGIPGSAGVTEGAAADTIVIPYNDTSAVDATFAAIGPEIAAVIVEPVAANMGLVPPDPGFLPLLRRRCREHGALLIVDEVITGFRVGLSGAQGRFDLAPDLSIFGKVIGGGLPLAAVGGPAALMDELAPLGPVYQAGTLSGNPLATAAGLAVLGELDAGAFTELERIATRLTDGLAKVSADAGIDAQLPRAWTLAGIFFAAAPVHDFEDARGADAARYASFFHGMLDRGVFLAPSAFESIFPSLAHTDADIDRTVDAARGVFASLSR